MQYSLQKQPYDPQHKQAEMGAHRPFVTFLKGAQRQSMNNLFMQNMYGTHFIWEMWVNIMTYV